MWSDRYASWVTIVDVFRWSVIRAQVGARTQHGAVALDHSGLCPTAVVAAEKEEVKGG